MKALIIGILGMDGSHMAELLHSKGYRVHGVVRPDTTKVRMDWLRALVPSITFHTTNILHRVNLEGLICEVNPDVIYNFAGETNVFNAWDNVERTFELNGQLPQRILELIRRIGPSIKYFQASSCLIFGRDKSGLQNEDTPISPIYPYGAAKAYADEMVKSYREQFGIFACSGILFPHESGRRGDGFFTKRVTSAVAKIKEGKQDKLELGDLSQMRDWTYSPDVCDAVHLMMQQKIPRDYVIGSGVLTKTEDFVRKCFTSVDLVYENHVVMNKGSRSVDTEVMRADISKIKEDLRWEPRHNVDDIIKIMINEHLNA